MGDMAEFAIGEAMDQDEARLEWRRGNMHVEEAYEQGIVNEMGGDIGTESRSSSKRCRRCGMAGLRWKMVGRRWRLFDDKKMHECPVVRLNEKTDRLLIALEGIRDQIEKGHFLNASTRAAELARDTRIAHNEIKKRVMDPTTRRNKTWR